jgi:hypothetical protein
MNAVFMVFLRCDAAATTRKHFFLKKEAKTFAYLAYALGQRARQYSKVFLFFFNKRTLTRGANPTLPTRASGNLLHQIKG